MKKSFYLFLFSLLFFSCSKNNQEIPANSIDGLCTFNESSSRFTFNEGLTNTSVDSQMTLQSVLRFNSILDSLTNAFAQKGKQLKIIYNPSIKKIVRAPLLRDDGVDTIEIEEPINQDSCEVYSISSGSLMKNDFSLELIDVSADYSIRVSGFCSCTYNGPIYAFLYNSYHTLVIEIDGSNVGYALVGECIANLFPYYSLFLGEASFDGPIYYIFLSYYNSELQSSIVWSCYYNISCSLITN